MVEMHWKHEDDRLIRLAVTFDQREVKLDETPAGTSVTVPGCRSSGRPGAPALPVDSVRVAIPPGMWPDLPRVEEGERVLLTDEPVLVVPVQPLAPGLPHDEGRCRCADCDCCSDEDPGGRGEDRGYTVDPFPVPAPVLPDVTLYEQSASDRRPVVVRYVDQAGPVPVVALDIRPVRYTEKGQLELVTRIEVEIPYAERPRDRVSDEQLRQVLEEAGVTEVDVTRLEPLPEPGITSRAQARRLTELLADSVLNAGMIDIGDRFAGWLDDRPADYLVITDNSSWDADTVTPTGPLPGDLVAAFQRLAAHKRSRGLTARVVTITDIVRGRYGDFRTGSRDLQEVIRRFLKDVHGRWGVAWVLLGGDVAVVPARYAAGGREGYVDHASVDPPADNTSFWTGSFLKMHAVSPGTWWPGSTPRRLVNPATGRLIPYDGAGATATGGLGWYWTASDYATRSMTPTDFVRVNGPQEVTDAPLQWLYEWNSIPTDFYYASLQSWVIAYLEVDVWLAHLRIPYVSFPAHDWDALDNGLYGQQSHSTDLDGVVWHTDVSVGRAPVQSGAEAATFVDKVIAYETYGQQLIRPWRDDFVRRVLIASSDWGGPVQIALTASNPPGDNSFHPGPTHTVIHLQAAPPDFTWQLIAAVSDSDRRELPYNTASSPASRGWHYAVSATDHGAPMTTVTIFGSTFTIPVTSRWIVVHGPADELAPAAYALDKTWADGSMADQEELRGQLAADLPGWSRVSRLYEDLTDLTPAQTAAAPVAYLTTTRLRAALDASPHIVSLSGHGNPDGCCGGSVVLAAGLRNGSPGFIGYADSCLTGASDSEDSFGETLLTNPDGGAVAYVGSTRFSWIGLGDDIQRAFFAKLRTSRSIGLLNDTRVAAVGWNFWPADSRWAVMSLTLYGDPEMRVWRTQPGFVWPWVTWPGKELEVPIEVRLPRPPEPDPPPFVVHVAQEGGFERTVRGAAGDVLRVDVSQARPGALTVSVAVDGTGEVVPFRQTFEARGAQWLTGTVSALSHRHEGQPWTEATVSVDGADHLVVVPGSDGDAVVHALVEAHLARSPISLRVDRGRVDRFRLP